MVSKDKYQKSITSFLNKYEKVLGKNVTASLSELWRWVSEYSVNMSDKVDVERRKIYIKRGANLLIKFVVEAKSEADSLQDSLLRCRIAILKGQTEKCNEKTKADLSKYIKDYNSFIQDLIGCGKQGQEYILSLLGRTADILGMDYIKIKNNLEGICLTLRKEALLID